METSPTAQIDPSLESLADPLLKMRRWMRSINEHGGFSSQGLGTPKNGWFISRMIYGCGLKNTHMGLGKFVQSAENGQEDGQCFMMVILVEKIVEKPEVVCKSMRFLYRRSGSPVTGD